MIVSHAHRFAFIHTPKTGGSSITAILAPLAHPGVDVTEKRGWQPRLHNVGWLHDGYDEQRQWIDAHPDYLTIAFVRNPFDRLASFYHHLGNPGESLRDFAVRMKRDPASVNWLRPGFAARSMRSFVGDCNLVGRFERLQISADQIMDRLGLPRVNVPHRNDFLTWQTHSSFTTEPDKPARGPYREAYDPSAIEAVEALWREDIETYGYGFP